MPCRSRWRHARFSDYTPWPDLTETAVQDAIPAESYGNFGLDLVGDLRAQDELGLALLIELRVEHLVIKVGSGLRLEKNACSGCLDDLVVLTRTSRSCDLQRARVFRFRCGGYDPQARPAGGLRGRGDGLDGLGGRLGQDQHAWSPFTSRPAEAPEVSRRCCRWVIWRRAPGRCP